jgi:phospholipid/cholesterol/gamma-HCH transport system substrate-binding protein
MRRDVCRVDRGLLTGGATPYGRGVRIALPRPDGPIHTSPPSPFPGPGLMSRDTHWRNLVPGLVAVAAIAAIALSVLVFARVGALHGDVLRLYAPTSEARGVLEGTEVWLEGQKIGRVIDIRFAPVTADTSRRLVIVMDVLKEYLPWVRRDSYAQIRTGTSLIGAPVVYLTVGTPSRPTLADGDTLATRKQEDVENMTGRFAQASQSFPAIIANIAQLNAQLTTDSGTAGALITSTDGIRRVMQVGGSANRLLTRATSGRGTVAMALSGQMSARVAGVRARTDSLRLLMSSPDASLGRFRRDSTLLRNLASVRAETDSVFALLSQSRGTAGRVLNDSALVREVADARRTLDALIKDVKADPLRYVAF